MRTLIERSQQARIEIDARQAAYEAEQRERARDEAMDRTVRQLRENWGVSPEDMTLRPDHEWSGVVEVEGMLVCGSYSRYASDTPRRLVTCPDCGALAVTPPLFLFELAENIEAAARSERDHYGRPVWIDRERHDECPGRSRPAPAACEPAPPSLAEQLAALIRQIAVEEIEARLPA
jgi:hypothetical protein